MEIDDSEPALTERRSSSTSEPVTEPAKKSSIMEQIAKKIRLDKEQRVRCKMCEMCEMCEILHVCDLFDLVCAQDESGPSVTPESVVEKFLSEPLETVRCLRWGLVLLRSAVCSVQCAVCMVSFLKYYTRLCRYYKDFQASSNGCKVKEAFLRVARQFLTPPPTSTNVERLFSYAGLIADEKRGRLQPERLEKILFLRENLAMLEFRLEW